MDNWKIDRKKSQTARFIDLYTVCHTFLASGPLNQHSTFRPLIQPLHSCGISLQTMGSKFFSTNRWCSLSPSGWKASTKKRSKEVEDAITLPLRTHLKSRGCNIWLFYCFGLLHGMWKFLVRHKFPVQWMQSMNGSLITKYCVMGYKLKTTEAFHPCVWDVWESQTLLITYSHPWLMPTEYFILPHKFHNGIEINDAPNGKFLFVSFFPTIGAKIFVWQIFEVLNKHITIFLNLDNQFLLCQWDLPIVSEGNEKATTLEKLPWSRPALGLGVAGWGIGLTEKKQICWGGADGSTYMMWALFLRNWPYSSTFNKIQKSSGHEVSCELNSSMVLFIWGYHLYPFHSISTPKN